MSDLMDTIPLKPLLEASGIHCDGSSFEDLYSSLCEDPARSEIRANLEAAVSSYFGKLKLPARPTVYDQLLLSLRSKDVVATFNWDPFLIQAYQRSARVTRSLPHLLFLHGNVAHGYCAKDRVSGLRGNRCSRCGRMFTPDRLLFPIRTKNYSSDPSIAASWQQLQMALQDCLIFTIFGYSAPSSDQDAVALMSAAWGSPQRRRFEQVQIIDVSPEEELSQRWFQFIHTHHYECCTSFSESFLGKHPRRSVESFFNQFVEAKFIHDNPIPETSSLDELHAWFRYLVVPEVSRGV
jgi:hypothetical protein